MQEFNKGVYDYIIATDESSGNAEEETDVDETDDSDADEDDSAPEDDDEVETEGRECYYFFLIPF